MRLQILLGVVLCVAAPAVFVVMASNAQETLSATEPAGDAARGKFVFEHRCTGCHALDANREGPRLRDAYGRKAGSVQGFEYSDGLKRSGVIWSEATLERWLTDPDGVVPGNNMSFATPKAADRRDVIAYLREVAVK